MPKKNLSKNMHIFIYIMYSNTVGDVMCQGSAGRRQLNIASK